MNIHLYVFMYVCMCPYMSMFILCPFICILSRIYTPTHIHVSLYIVCVSSPLCLYMCILVLMSVCMCDLMCIHTHFHFYTCTIICSCVLYIYTHPCFPLQYSMFMSCSLCPYIYVLFCSVLHDFVPNYVIITPPSLVNVLPLVCVGPAPAQL